MAKFPRFRPGETFGFRGPGGTLVLDQRAANVLNVAAREMARLGNVSAAAPLNWEESDAGRRLAIDLPPSIWAKLSGSGNPYSFVQQSYDPIANTWSDMAGGRTGTSNTYESTGKSGLAGKVVRIEYVATANDWRFHYVGSKPPTLAWKFRINGCSSPTSTGVAGAVIELRQSGTLIASCTTADGTGGTTLGECTMTVPAGSYDITITGPTGKGFATQTFTASATTLTTRTLTADASHVCVGSLCNFPIPKTLFTTDTLGTHTLTWNGTIWEGTATTTANVFADNCVTTGTMTVTYQLGSSLGALTVFWHAKCCKPGASFINFYADDSATFVQFANSTGGSRTALSCNPISLTFNVGTTGFGTSCPGVGVGFSTPGGGGSLTVTP